MRQLAAWGPLAFGALRQAASGPDLEAALVARDLLDELETAVLIGAQVRIEVNRARVNWDEPVTLVLSAHNLTGGPLRVPWPGSADTPATHPAHDDASQVAAMLDAADFLIVTGPDGQPVDLRIEPIDRDRAVYQVVDVRARATPPSHLVEPGQTACLRVPLFNRGWARYPMLSAGTYTIAFAHQPQWRDESWTKEGFGLVRADPVSVEVLQGAPEAVRRSARPLVLRLRRAGEMLIAELQSTWDRTQWINLNLGSELAVQARLEWRLLPMADSQAELLVLGLDATPPVFRLDRTRALGPGEALTIARADVATIHRWAREAGVDEPGTVELSVRYLHIATPQRLREYLRARNNKGKVPADIFTGSVSSEPIELSIGK